MVTSSDMLAALRTRYAPPEWALFQEVRNHTGWNSGDDRYADAIAMNLWPSGGLEVHGFEIKVTRADWLNELKQPAKADSVRRYCDRWWLVSPYPLVVSSPAEIPEGWGLLGVQDGRLATVVKAPRLVPVPLDRSFIASVLRAAHDREATQERQAQKAVLLAAPMRAVTRADYVRGKYECTLSPCGHVTVRPSGRGVPKAARCLECASSSGDTR